MTEFQLYDVLTTCRDCATQFTGKAFLPPTTEPRFGLCPSCKEVDEAHMSRLKQPPKSYGKPKTAEPDPRSGSERRRFPTRQTRWEPD